MVTPKTHISIRFGSIRFDMSLEMVSIFMHEHWTQSRCSIYLFDYVLNDGLWCCMRLFCFIFFAFHSTEFNVCFFFISVVPLCGCERVSSRARECNHLDFYYLNLLKNETSIDCRLFEHAINK